MFFKLFYYKELFASILLILAMTDRIFPWRLEHWILLPTKSSRSGGGGEEQEQEQEQEQPDRTFHNFRASPHVERRF